MEDKKQFSIRKATIEEIPLIRELTFRIWPQTYAEILSAEQIEYMLELMYSEPSLQRQMTEEKCIFIIAYSNAEAVGFASYSEISPAVYKLHKIYVLSSQQGRGTGRFVIDHIIKDISAKNGKALRLQVNRYNSARQFYEKLGFTLISEVKLDIGNGFFMDDYIMEKKL